MWSFIWKHSSWESCHGNSGCVFEPAWRFSSLQEAEVIKNGSYPQLAAVRILFFCFVFKKKKEPIKTNSSSIFSAHVCEKYPLCHLPLLPPVVSYPLQCFSVLPLFQPPSSPDLRFGCVSVFKRTCRCVCTLSNVWDILITKCSYRMMTTEIKKIKTGSFSSRVSILWERGDRPSQAASWIGLSVGTLGCVFAVTCLCWTIFRFGQIF